MKNFIVYRASAGAGKTFTLVKDYLKLLFSSENPGYYQHILAVTFTNKAANEMKVRIIENLQNIADNPSENNMLKIILQENPQWNLTQIQEKSQKIIAHLLHNYANFSISTIDTFFNRVARSFAFDLNLPLNYEVELQEDVIQNLAIDALLKQIGENKTLTEIIKNYTLLKLAEGENKKIKKELLKVTGAFSNEEGRKYLSEIENISLEEFYAKIKKYQKEYHRLKNAALDYFKKYQNIKQQRNVAEVTNLKNIDSFFTKLSNGN
ncbi:MAG: DNA helicase UvrD, partial [Bacteroidetes bacterium]